MGFDQINYKLKLSGGLKTSKQKDVVPESRTQYFKYWAKTLILYFEINTYCIKG